MRAWSSLLPASFRQARSTSLGMYKLGGYSFGQVATIFAGLYIVQWYAVSIKYTTTFAFPTKHERPELPCQSHLAYEVVVSILYLLRCMMYSMWFISILPQSNRKSSSYSYFCWGSTDCSYGRATSSALRNHAVA